MVPKRGEVCQEAESSMIADPDQPDRQQANTPPTEQEQYHPTAEKLKGKKTRHKRNGSHGSSIRDSPHYERKVSLVKYLMII